jgi:hypothetical protein
MTSWEGVSTEQQVVLDGSKSKSAPVLSGGPQGSVLVPLLFLLYINNLPNYIKNNSTVRLFADDCVLYRKINRGLSFTPTRPGGFTGMGKVLTNGIPSPEMQSSPYNQQEEFHRAVHTIYGHMLE